MLRGTRLGELIDTQASLSLEAFIARNGTWFLLVEMAPRPAMDAKFLTTLAPVDPDDDRAHESWLAFSVPSGPLTGSAGVTLPLDENGSAASVVELRFRDVGAAAPSIVAPERTTLNNVALQAGLPCALHEGDVLEVAQRVRATLVSAASLHERLKRAAASRDKLGNVDAGPTASSITLPRRAGLLAGKVAVITGGGRGVGRAYALRFAEEGCSVVVNDNGAAPDGTGRDDTVAPGVVLEIEKAGGVAVASTHDVSDPTQVAELFRLASERFGAVDVLACCAGAIRIGPSVLETTRDDWERVVGVNAFGTLLCIQAAARQMIERQKPGRIITTSSLMAIRGSAGITSYSASKLAIQGLSMTAAIELAPHGITVNTITPMAWTRLTSAVPAIAAIPGAEQLFSPRFIADVALFLASDLASEITGQIVDVAGERISVHGTRQSEVQLPKEGRWSPQELHRRWGEITGS